MSQCQINGNICPDRSGFHSVAPPYVPPIIPAHITCDLLIPTVDTLRVTSDNGVTPSFDFTTVHFDSVAYTMDNA